MEYLILSVSKSCWFYHWNIGTPVICGTVGTIGCTARSSDAIIDRMELGDFYAEKRCWKTHGISNHVFFGGFSQLSTSINGVDFHAIFDYRRIVMSIKLFMKVRPPVRLAEFPGLIPWLPGGLRCFTESCWTHRGRWKTPISSRDVPLILHL